MKTARSYQSAALTALWDWIYTREGHPFIAAAVNAGKAFMIAKFIRQIFERWDHMKVIMLIDDMKLLQQNMDELREVFPSVDAGFYCASLKQKRLNNAVTLASIQSIYKKAALLDKAPNVIIVDEAHKISHKTGTKYRQFIDDCLALNPRCKVIGWSGSEYRTDTGHVCKGKNALFSGVAYEISVRFMIEQGYSVRPVMPKTKLQIDTSSLPTANGDFIEKHLQEAVDVDEITKAAVYEIIHVGQSENRKQWIVYTAGITHCEHVYEEFKRRGISVEMAHSQISEQDDIVKRYKANEFQCLVNVLQYTTGFSHNGIELIANLRPTRSTVVYEQVTGRGMRTNYAPGMPLDTKEQRLAAIAASCKPDFCFMDFGGTVEALGAVDNIQYNERVYQERDASDPVEPRIKPCPQCESPCAPAHKVCYSCGYEFPVKADVNANADRNSAILQADIEPEKLAVIGMTLSKHRKKTPEGTPPATPVMKVTYQTYAGNIYEWICFEHEGFALNNAKKWHNKFMPAFVGTYPHSVDFALECHREGNERNQYRTPSSIIAVKNGKYWEVKDHEFPEPKTEQEKEVEEFDWLSTI